MGAPKISFVRRLHAWLAMVSIFVQGPVAVAMECDGRVWLQIAKKRRGEVDLPEMVANTEKKLNEIASPKPAAPKGNSVAAKAARAEHKMEQVLGADLAKEIRQNQVRGVGARQQGDVSERAAQFGERVPSSQYGVSKKLEQYGERVPSTQMGDNASRATGQQGDNAVRAVGQQGDGPSRSSRSRSPQFGDGSSGSGQMRASNSFAPVADDAKRIGRGAFRDENEVNAQSKAIRALVEQAPRPGSAEWNSPGALSAYSEKVKADGYRAEGVINYLTTRTDDVGKLGRDQRFLEAKQAQRLASEVESRLAALGGKGEALTTREGVVSKAEIELRNGKALDGAPAARQADNAPAPGGQMRASVSFERAEKGLESGFVRQTGGMYDLQHGALVQGSVSHGGLQPHYVTDFHTSPKLAPLRKFAAELREANVPVEEKVSKLIDFIQRKALVRGSYDDPKYLQLIKRYRDAGKDIPLSAYMDCKAGVCRENALYTHFALKEAGVENQYVYAKVQQQVRDGRRITFDQVEDHAFTVVKINGERFIVDSYNSNFHGMSFDQLQDPAFKRGMKLRHASFAEKPDQAVFRRVVEINEFPVVYQPESGMARAARQADNAPAPSGQMRASNSFAEKPAFASVKDETANSFSSLVSKRLEEQRDFIGRLKNNQTEVFGKPFPFDTQFDVYAVTKTADGEIFHIKPSHLAEEVKALEGANHVPQSTYFNDARAFWEHLGFKERCHEAVGCYFTTFPSAKEFEARKKTWNEKALRENRPERVIEMTYLEGDIAPMQRGMAQNMVANGGATHMQDPTKVFMERYAPVGGGQHEHGAFQKLVVDPATGRVQIKGSLGRHDLMEMMNSPFIPREVLGAYVEQSYAHLRMLEILKGKGLRIEGDDISAFKKTFDGFVNAKDGKSAAQDRRAGISAERFQEALLHHAMAAQHSDFHLGGWLLKHPEGINPAAVPEFGWGNVFQKEIQMHLARVGARAPNSDPPFLAPMVIENFKLAKETTDPITLERMLAHNINTSNQRFLEGFERIRAAAVKQSQLPDPQAAEQGRSILKELDEFKAGELKRAQELAAEGKTRRSIFDSRPYTETELKEIAQKYRDKHASIASVRDPARESELEKIAMAPSRKIADLKRADDIVWPQSNRTALTAMHGRVDDVVNSLGTAKGLSETRVAQLKQAQAILDFPGMRYTDLSPDLQNNLYRLAFTARSEAREAAGGGVAARVKSVIEDFEAVAMSGEGERIRVAGDARMEKALTAAITEIEKIPVALFSPEASHLAKQREEAFVKAFKASAGDTPENDKLARRFSHVCQAGANCGSVDPKVTAQADGLLRPKEAPVAAAAKAVDPKDLAESVAKAQTRPFVGPVVRGPDYGTPAFAEKLKALDRAVAEGDPTGRKLAEALAERPTLATHLKAAEIEKLPVPLLQDSMTEIWGVSYPRGKAAGPLYHIRIRDDVKAVMAAHPEAFTKEAGWTALGNRINAQNKGLMDFLHVSGGSHPQAGNFYATRPSPTLFNALADEFNTFARHDPAEQIRLKGIVSGADTQWQMAEYFSKYGAIGFPDPARNTPYAPTGLGNKGSSLAKTIEVETLPNGKKVVKGYDKGLEFHDGDEFLSAMTVSQRTFDARRTDDTYIHKAWKAARAEDGKDYQTARVFDLRGKGSDADLAAAKNDIVAARGKDYEGVRLQAFSDTRTGKVDDQFRREMNEWVQKIYDSSVAAQKKAEANMPAGLSPAEQKKYLRDSSWSAAADRGLFVDKNGKVIGIAESRYVELEMYLIERHWHSGFHAHGYLADHPGGLSAYERVTKYGPMYEKENVLHMAGLGARTVAVDPPPVSALIGKTVTNATDMSGLNMEKARAWLFTHNRDQMARMGNLVRGPEAKKAFADYLQARPAYTPNQIKAFAKEEIDLHKNLLARGRAFEQASGLHIQEAEQVLARSNVRPELIGNVKQAASQAAVGKIKELKAAGIYGPPSPSGSSDIAGFAYEPLKVGKNAPTPFAARQQEYMRAFNSASEAQKMETRLLDGFFDREKWLRDKQGTFSGIDSGAENGKFKALAEAANRGEASPVKRSVLIESAVTKELNDAVVKDKDLVTALMNTHKDVLWVALQRDPLISQHLVGKYTDFKSMKFAFSDNSPALEKRLKEVFTDVNRRYAEFITAEARKQGWDKNVTGLAADVKNWHHMGIGATPDEANWAARKSRELFDRKGLSEPRAFADVKPLAATDVAFLKSLREDAAKRLGDTRGMFVEEAGKKVLSAEAIETIRKAKPAIPSEKGMSEAVKKALEARFGRAMDPRDVDLLRAYVAKADALSPDLYLGKRVEIPLAARRNGIVSADFKGQNARNLEETMKALARTEGRALTETMREIRRGEEVATAALDKKKAEFLAAVKRLDPEADDFVFFSGDDGIFLPSRKLTDAEKRQLAAATANQDLRLTYNWSHYADDLAEIPKEKLSHHIVEAEQLEKDLRKEMIEHFPRDQLNRAQLAIDMTPHSSGARGVGVLIGGDLPEAQSAAMKRWVEDFLAKRAYQMNFAETIPAAAQDNRFVARASNSFAPVMVRGAAIVPPSGLVNAPAAVQLGSAYRKAAELELADARRAFLNRRGSFADYQAVAREHQHLEPPFVASTEEGQRAELLRREARYLEREVAEARAENELKPTPASAARLADLERTHAAVSLQAAGEALVRPADPLKARLMRLEALRSFSSDASLAADQHHFAAKAMSQVAAGADAGVLSSVRDERLLADAAQAAVSRRAAEDWIARSLAGGDTARARKLAADVADLHAQRGGSVKPQEFLARRGWKPEEATACLASGGLCKPLLSVRSAEIRSGSVSSLARKVNFQEELTRPGADGVAEAYRVARPGNDVLAGADPLRAAHANLENQAKQLAREARTFKGKPEELAEIVRAQKTVEERAKLLAAKEKELAAFKPAGAEEALRAAQRDNASVTGVMEFLASRDKAALRAELDARGIKAPGFEEFAMKGMAKGDDRLASYQAMKAWMAEKADAATIAKVAELFDSHLAKKPGFEKLKVGATETEKAIREGENLARATGAADPRLAALVQKKAGLSEERQSVLRALGANKDGSKSVVETVAESQARERAVVAQVSSEVRAGDGRGLASLETPRTGLERQFTKGKEDELAAFAKAELAKAADAQGARALDEAMQKEIVAAARVVEEGGSEATVRLMAARMAGFSSDPMMLESARDAYREMAAYLKAHPEVRSKPNWRQVVMEKGVEEMLRKSGFSAEEISGKTNPPGMLKRTTACLKL